MAYSLFICALPIGHDQDITLRCLDCLTHVSAIACEDTRVIKHYLKRLGILSNQRLFRLDQHIENAAQFKVFKSHIQKGNVAYVSDAGTPGISDPGATLVNYCHNHDIPVEALPGASSLSAFISICGHLMGAFHFGGFFPRKPNDIIRATTTCITNNHHGIWFESPKRLSKSIDIITAQFPTVSMVVAKELTKPFSRILRGSAKDILDTLSTVDTRGEWIILIDGTSIQLETTHINDTAVALKQAGLSGKQVKSIAHLLDCPKKRLYDQFQTL